MKRLVLGFGAAAATLAAAWAAAPRLVALGAGATLVPATDPTVILEREVTEEFGFENPVLWVLEARDGNVWTPEMLRRLAALTEEVRRIPGVVALDVIGLASPNMRDLRVTDEGLEPIYLMGEVPETAEAIGALRHRIDGDPNYAGTLVTRDGRAAMVVANFRRGAEARAVGTAALALRDRYRDAATAVWAAGAPVLAAAAPAAFGAVALRAALFALAGLAVFGSVLGARPAASALLAAALAAVWLALGTALAGGTVPWALEAAVPTMLVAAAVVAGAGRPVALAAAVLAAGALAGALVTEPPARALWLGTAAGAPLAVAAGRLARMVTGPAFRPPAGGATARLVAAALALAALPGAWMVRGEFGLLGYGERYLPPAASADLAAVRRLFPPPAQLAVRARGEPGFVTAPAVLHALDGVAAAARADPAVSSAMSIADVVRMVNRAFNDDRPEFAVIPDDRVMVGRYLALAYSPTFRRFVDRAFGDTAVWIQVRGERPADLERVLARVRAALTEQPVPGATVDLPAGDGAVLLLMARTARRLATAAGLAVLIVTAAAGAAAGLGAAARAAGCALGAAAVGAGVLGWGGGAVDLVSVPLLAGAVVAAAALGGVAPLPARFGLALAGAGAVALAAPLPAAALVAALLAGPALTGLAVSSDV